MPRLDPLANIPIASLSSARRQADMDLVTRLTAGGLVYVVLLLLIGIATPYRVNHRVLFWECTLAIGIGLSVRIVLFVLRNSLHSKGRVWVVVLTLLSMVLSSGPAGLLHLHIVKSYGLSNWTFTLVMMWILGIAAGSTITFTPSFSLFALQMILLFGPALPYEFLPSTPHGLGHGLSTLAFVGFLFLQGHRLHRMYWELLADRANEIERAHELELAKRAAEQAQEQLKYQATHDLLTDALNRAEVLRVLRRELDRALRSGESLGLVMIDIDNFKQVNDRFGHLAGDDVLRSVAERIRTNLRSYDALGRYGGEEFLVILPACDLEQCAASAERIRVAIERGPVELHSTSAEVTASFGVTVLDAKADTDQRQLIARADSALYEAKKKGRNRVEVNLSGLLLACSLPA